MLLYLKLLLQLFLAPRQGWEDISVDNLDPDELARRGLYPLAGIAALSSFMTLVYHSGISIASVFIAAIVRFGAYFAGYFITIFALTTCMPRVSEEDAEADQHEIKLFAVCMMGLMAIIGVIRNSLPSDFAIVNFLYLYLAIIMWRGKFFLRVAESKTVVFVILAVVSVIVPPLLIMML
ncbi:MAG: hypothetical protein HDR92_06480 [Bacteroides sp.]|nr:hypothetical protein [Bacteroides sp.]